MDSHWVAGAIAAAMLFGATTVGATGGLTIFEQLHQIDMTATSARLEAGELRSDAAAVDKELTSRWETADVAMRAARPIRAGVAQGLVRWLGASRAADREASDGPYAAADTQRLLRYASRRALPAKLRDVDVIRRADAERAGFDELLNHRVRLAVEVARIDSLATAATDGRDVVLAGARSGGARADLDATDAEFAGILDGLPGIDGDFHRFKGTLARPVMSSPSELFGSDAPLVRGNGWTYRPERDADVYAVHAGEVVYVGAVEGWGLVLVIAHGGGYRSVYGHLENTNFRVGDNVARADVVAAVGDSGSLDGARLYFELRKDEAPVDPSGWFLRK